MSLPPETEMKEAPKIERSKSVKWAEADDDEKPSTSMMKSSKSFGANGGSQSMRRSHDVDGFLGIGSGSESKSALRRQRRRRRFWRKFWMMANPTYWFYVINRELPIIPEDNQIRRYWDGLMLALVIWACCIIPYEVGFGFNNVDRYPLSEPDEPRYPVAPMDSPPEPESTAVHAIMAMEWVITALFLIDIGVNFRTAYIDHTASVVRDGGRIAAHYARTWFPIDFLATIPWDKIVLLFMDNASETVQSALLILRLPRILRLARLLSVFDRLPGANLIRLTKLLFFIVMVSHWINCMWFLLFRLFRYSIDEPWSIEMQLGMNSKMTTYYLNGYYNAFVLMIGNDIYPGNDIETTYCIFVIIFGACFYAVIIGNISLLVNNMNPTNSRHKAKKDVINNAIRYLDAPKPLAKQVDNYFEYLTTFSHPGPDGIQLLSQLPTSMYHDISKFMYVELIKRVPLFADVEEAFITQLVVRLKMSVYLPGEVIFSVGDVGHEMYFIVKGNVAVTNRNKEMLALLCKGGFFGELALLATARRTAQCVALSHADLSILMATDLLHAMRDFPESAVKVQMCAANRLSNLQASGAAANMRAGQHDPRHLKQINSITGRDYHSSNRSSDEEESDYGSSDGGRRSFGRGHSDRSDEERSCRSSGSSGAGLGPGAIANVGGSGGGGGGSSGGGGGGSSGGGGGNSGECSSGRDSETSGGDKGSNTAAAAAAGAAAAPAPATIVGAGQVAPNEAGRIRFSIDQSAHSMDQSRLNQFGKRGSMGRHASRNPSLTAIREPEDEAAERNSRALSVRKSREEGRTIGRSLDSNRSMKRWEDEKRHEALVALKLEGVNLGSDYILDLLKKAKDLAGKLNKKVDGLGVELTDVVKRMEKVDSEKRSDGVWGSGGNEYGGVPNMPNIVI